MEEYEFTLMNTPSGLESVQSRIQAVLQAADMRPSVISHINIALGEWIENIIQHAYPDGEPHQISVHCTLGPAEFVVRVVDDGRPFDPCEYPVMDQADGSMQGVHTGRGIHMIRGLMDRMEHQRQNGMNTLILTKNFARR